MATTITTNFDSYYLTAHLPESVNITTSESSIEVVIYVDNNEAFRSTFYPYNGIVCVRDIRSIVEAEMIEQQIEMGILEIDVNVSGGDSSVVDDVKVIYSAYKSLVGSVSFLSTSFLTTRKSMMIPRDEELTLKYLDFIEADKKNSAEIYYSVPAVSKELTFKHKVYYNSLVVLYQITSATITSVRFKKVVDEANLVDSKIHRVNYKAGNRSFDVFFTDEQPSEVFSFLNAFNVLERVYLYGTTTTKTEVNRSEAMLGRKMQFYDETVNVKREVETAPLPIEEALWMNQLFTSKWVRRVMEDGTMATVLISDVTSEVTDSNKELVRLKFSWRYDDGVEWV